MTDPISNERLLPCPFCGNAERPSLGPYTGEPYFPGFIVQCNAYGFDGDPAKGCGAATGWCGSEAEAIAAWNRRQSPAGMEPFGYWCECKGAEPAFLRKPAYIPPSDALHTTTPLYASPPKAATITDEMVERVFQAVMPFMAGTAYRELRTAITAALSSEAHNGQ